MLAALLAALVALQAPAPPAPPSPPAAPAPTSRALRTPAPPRPPRALPAAPLPGEGQLLGEWPAKPSGKRVTLKHKMSVDDALDRIADAAGWNLVANTGRSGDRVLVLTVRDVPVEEALQAVLAGSPLAATRRGDTVTVAPYLPTPPRGEVETLSGFDKPTGKKFSGDFKDTPVDQALKRIAQAGGLSVVLPPGLRGSVTASFKDTPVEEALRAVLAQSDLTASRQGSVITVSRESGPRIVISGGKRRFQFGVEGLPDSEEIAAAAREAAEEAQQALEDAAQDLADESQSPGMRGAKDRVVHGDLTVGPGERVRDVVAIRGNVKLEPGAVAREATAVVGSVEIGPGAAVLRNATAVGGDLHVAAGARVGRDATSVGGKVVLEPGAQVEGTETAVPIPGLGGLLGLALGAGGFGAKVSPAVRIAGAVAEFAVIFALGLLTLLLFPRRIEGVGASLNAAPWKALLAGLLGTMAMPVLTVLLVVTIIGIPLVVVQWLGVMVAGILGIAALALLVGRRLPLKLERGQAVAQLAIGTALLVLVGKVPVLGTMVWIAAWLFVFGAVLRTRFGQTLPAEPLPTTPAGVPPPPPAAPA
ncbi:MAG TPA: STN domain-containing protein [Anaeromyxobacteraceae bacterium]|nr:STN domain-containing protein [Anaeromyxobacteraceae bacterium]